MGIHAYFWDGGPLVDLGALPGHLTSSASGINNRGEVVGWSSPNYGGQDLIAVIWKDGKIRELGALPGHHLSIAEGINDAGEITGFSMPAGGGPRAVIWRKGRIVDLGTPSWSPYCEGYAINNRGQVTGRAGNRAFLWTEGEFVDLGMLPGGYVFAIGYGINESGEVVGHVSPPDGRTTTGFRWDRGVMTELPLLPGGHVGMGKGVTNAGVIVGRADDGIAPFYTRIHAAIWNKAGALSVLNPLTVSDGGAQYAVATAINNRGQVVGESLNAQSLDVAVVWTT